LSAGLQAGRAVALLAAVALAPAARAQDAPEAPPGNVAAGRTVAQHVCQICHGLNGIAKQPDAANLAGQDPNYLWRQLTAFHSGDRKNETMGAVAQMLSPQQMADVAAYFGGIKIEVKSIPGQ
jgi:cytochrome c553